MNKDQSKNILFVCSRNKWRSPTAEAVWRKAHGVNARSAGTSKQAKRKISISDIRWADMILFMEQKHKQRVCAEFRQDVAFVEMHVLDIPDDYTFMDSELIEIVQLKVKPYLFNE